MSTPSAADSFWSFSQDFYALPGVAPACFALQDGHARDGTEKLEQPHAVDDARGAADADDNAARSPVSCDSSSLPSGGKLPVMVDRAGPQCIRHSAKAGKDDRRTLFSDVDDGGYPI